jgi:hypothetical protein
MVGRLDAPEAKLEEDVESEAASSEGAADVRPVFRSLHDDLQSPQSREGPAMGKQLRCRLGKHEWRLRKGRFQEWDAEEQTYYWCPACGDKRLKLRTKWGAAEAPGKDAPGGGWDIGGWGG